MHGEGFRAISGNSLEDGIGGLGPDEGLRVEPPELADDARQRSADDVLVERSQRQGGQEPGQAEAEGAAIDTPAAGGPGLDPTVVPPSAI